MFNKLTYSIIGGQTNSEFVINNLGQIALYASNTLDRETFGAYNLTVQCVDGGTAGVNQRTTTTTAIINVLDINDNAPSFGAGPHTRSIAENSAAGTALTGGAVVATDPDNGANASLTYSITGVRFNTSAFIHKLDL